MDLSEPEPGSLPCSTARQERYCLARLEGMTPPEAHIHAGYSDKTAHTWKVECTPTIRFRVGWLKAQAAALVVNANAVTRSELIEITRDNIRQAKSGTPVLDKEGNETGFVKLDLSAANRAVEILAKMHGFMTDVTRVESFDEELEGMDVSDIQSLLLSLLEQVDPNLRKQLVAEISKTADEDLSDDRVLQ